MFSISRVLKSLLAATLISTTLAFLILFFINEIANRFQAQFEGAVSRYFACSVDFDSIHLQLLPKILLDLQNVRVNGCENDEKFRLELSQLSGNFEYAWDESLWGISGALNIRGAKSESPRMTWENLDLRELNVGRGEEGRDLLAANLEFQLADFSTEVQEYYAARKTTGKLQIFNLPDGGSEYAGQLTFTDFAFKDSSTNMSEVNANLEDISGKIDSAGNSIFKVALHANSIKLQDQDFQILSAEKVFAPLEINIPADGGYLVSGPVQVAGGELLTSDKRLSHTSGLVEMSLTGPKKRFVSSNLSTTVKKEQILGRCDFEMEQTRYHLRSFGAKAFGGEIGATVSMGRKSEKKLELDVSASELSLDKVLRTVSSSKTEVSGVQIKGLTAELTAEKGQVRQTLEGEGALAGVDRDGQTFHLTFDAKKGVLKTNNLRLESSSRAISAAGIYSLVDGFDIKGTASYLFKKLKIPFKVRGHLPKPNVQVDKSKLSSFGRLIAGFF